MFAPPARSMQMNGILPAPWTAKPQACFSASRSGESCACAARGLAKRPNSVGAMTVAVPATKPCATNWRRVTGRGWSGWRYGPPTLGSPRRDFLFIVASSSLQQRAGAADHGRAGRLHHDFRAIRGATTAAGRETAHQRVDFGGDLRGVRLRGEPRADRARPERPRDLGALGRGVERSRRGRDEVEPREVSRAAAHVVHELVAILDRELCGANLMRGQEALDVLDRGQLLAHS